MAGEATTAPRPEAVVVRELARPKGAPVNPNLKPEHQALVARVRADTATTTHSPAEAMQRAVDTHALMSEGRGTNAINQSIGTEKNKDGTKNLNPDEQKRADAAKKADALARAIAEKGKGLDGLTVDADKKLVRAQIEHMLTVSGGLEYYNSLDANQKVAYINAILTDKDFIAAVKTRYGEVTQTSIEDAVTAAQVRANESAAIVKARKRERDSIKAELAGAKAAQDLFASGSDTAGEIAKLEAAGIDQKLAKANARVKRLETTIETYRIAMAQRRNIDTTDYVGEISRLGGELETANGDVDSLAENQARLKVLKEGKEGLPDRIRKLEKQKTEAQEALIKARTQEDTDKRALNEARHSRVAAENQFVSDMQNIISEAAVAYKMGALSKAEERALADLKKVQAESIDGREGVVAGILEKRYFTEHTPNLFDRSTVKPNKANLLADLKMITKPGGGGPEAILRRELNQHYRDEIVRQHPGYTQAEVDSAVEAKMKQSMDDPEFVKVQARKIAEQVVGGYIRSGGGIISGGISRDTYSYIASQEWGQGLIEKGAAMIQGNKEAQAKLKELGIHGPAGLREFLKTRKGKAAGGILAILLSVGAGLMTGPLGGAAILGAAGAYGAGANK